MTRAHATDTASAVDLRRRYNALNKSEARNTLAPAVFLTASANGATARRRTSDTAPRA